jgi:microcystin-dependent protein
MSRKIFGQSLAALTLIMGTAGFNTANACSSDGYIATLGVFAGNFAIRNCALAHGQLLEISSNTALFSLVGTLYGGDGRSTFGLPETRGRSIIGAGSGPGLSTISLGQKGGREAITLTVANMPAHTHEATAEVEVTGLEAMLNAYYPSWGENGKGNNSSNSEQYINAWKATVWSENVPNATLSPMSIDLVAGGDPSGTVTVESAGGGTAVNIRDPYIGMHWLIQVAGIYPSRN